MSMEQWRAERLMKRVKKKARKALEKQGHHRKTAAKLVNQSLKRIQTMADAEEQ